jgi:hypothetical protein
MAAKTYLVHNSAEAGAAAPVKQTTTNAVHTMMQLAPATGFPIRIIEWGCSFDGSAAATPGEVECFATTAVQTSLSTAYAVGDIQPFSDPNAPANTSGTSGVPLNLGTSLSGFSTGALTEVTPTAVRMFDLQLLSPTQPYVKQFPLGREPEFGGGGTAQYLRIRTTFGTAVNMYCYVIFEV